MPARSRLGPGGVPRPGDADFTGKAEEGASAVAESAISPNWRVFQDKGQLVTLTDGAVSGKGTFELQGEGSIGALLVTTDGSNAAAVVLRKNNASGARLFDMSTKGTVFQSPKVAVRDTSVVYYDVSGTGAKAQFYEWHN